MQQIDIKRIAKSILIWMALIPLAILNGALRDNVLTPWLGNVALPLSGIILSLLIFGISVILIPKLGKGNQKTYIVMGMVWLVLTIVFEFGFSLTVEGIPLSVLLAAYDITTGNLWLLVLLTSGISPWLAAKIRHII